MGGVARLPGGAAAGEAFAGGGGGAKAVAPGGPVRTDFFSIAPRTPQKPFHLLITGGSQGALAINRTVVDAMDRLAARKNELAIVHQTGERHYNAVRTAYARREYPAEVVPFPSNMAEPFSCAAAIASPAPRSPAPPI